MQKGRHRLKSLCSSCIDTNNLDVCNAFAHGEENSITLRSHKPGVKVFLKYKVTWESQS